MKKNTGTIHLIPLFILFASTVPVTAQKHNDSQILFIYMRLKDNVLTLEKTEVVKGNLKSKRFNSGNLFMEITSETDALVHSRLIDKPQNIFYDYIDDDDQLQGGVSKTQDDLFVIKVPFNKSMKNISFYSIKPPTNDALGKKRSESDYKGTLIGKFPLHPDIIVSQ